MTGGAGFIGSHTCLSLLENGYEIFVIDSYINSSRKSLENVLKILKKKYNRNLKNSLNLFEGDLKNVRDIEAVFQKANEVNKSIEAVIHFAGLKSVSESMAYPLCYWENNFYGTINLLKIMEKYNCKNIVFSSSATVYQTKINQLLNERDKCSPVNPYGQTKLAVEKLLKDIYKSAPSEWRIACLRYFNPVGAHESGLIGEAPFGKPNNLFPQITKVAIGIMSEIKIFGSDWPTPDGTGIRDYIHVMDLSEGHISSLNYLLKEKPQMITLNLGTGKGTSVKEFIRTFEKINNVEIPFSFVERRPGDNAFVVADNSFAKSILSWEPSRNIEDICRNGWNWQVMNPDGY